MLCQHPAICALVHLWEFLVCHFVLYVDRVGYWIRNKTKARGQPPNSECRVTEDLFHLSKLSTFDFQAAASHDLVSRLETELDSLLQESASTLGYEGHTSAEALMKFRDKTQLLDNLVLKVLEAADAHAIRAESRPVIDWAIKICIQENVTTMLGNSPAPESSLEYNSAHDSGLFERLPSKAEHRLKEARENPGQADGPICAPVTTTWYRATGRIIRPESPSASDHVSANL